MTYPGNASLAADVQHRVQEAYRHSLESASDGNRQEALLGCDFILRLDPSFAPARTLQQMLDQNRPPEAYREILAHTAAAPSSRSFTAAAPGLVTTFTRLLEARKFEELLGAAQSQSAAVSGDPKLRDLILLAQSRFEAEPLVRQLLDSARRALGSGKLDQVGDLLEKVRELDSTHPGVAEIERLRSSAATLHTSLKIDWDEDERSTAVPPPADFAGADLFSEPDLPPIAPPVQTPFRLDSPEFAPQAPVEPASSSSDPTPLSLDLPEIDFSVDTAPQFEPGLLDSEPAPGTESRSEEETDAAARVQALLDEGEAAFGRGEYQGAIDSWSRIFLIDIDNGEAARRIERARQLKAEREREVEEIFHGAVARFDSGDLGAAREAFLKVLEVQPSYVLAREYLEKIEEREAGGDSPSLGLPEIAAATFAVPKTAEAGGETATPRGRGEVIMVPPEPGTQREARRPAIDGFAVKARRSARPSPMFALIGGAVLALLAVGGWLLVGNWEKLFPNARPVAAAPPTPSPVAQAKKLQAEGKTAVAIAQLRRIPPQDSSYAEAQSLISQWEKLVAAAAAPAIPEVKLIERRALLDRADAAVDVGENLLARRLYAQAGAISPLDGEAVRRASAAEEQAAAYEQEMALLRDGEYEMALNRLWRRHDADPANRDTRRLMVDAYYNLSLGDLQRGAPGDARQKLKEARALDRSDPMLDRLERFCATYERREPDLLYRIFVKYLPLR